MIHDFIQRPAHNQRYIEAKEEGEGETWGKSQSQHILPFKSQLKSEFQSESQFCKHFTVLQLKH